MIGYESRRYRYLIVLLLLLFFLAGCQTAEESRTAAPTADLTPTGIHTDDAQPMASALPPAAEESAVLTDTEATILSSLRKVDDYPLYTMVYSGATGRAPDVYNHEKSMAGMVKSENDTDPAWACSLFAAFGDSESMIYGRNFDWRYSPALLLFTDPPDGYASVSMVDIEYLGFGGGLAGEVDRLPLHDQRGLLDAPSLPFDGMNEQGLVVGMAAVQPGEMLPDPGKEAIGSLGVIREILDHASSTEKAVAIMANYNIDMGGGPPLHYLVADAKGTAVVVEFYQGEMKVIANQSPWHSATNFIKSAYDESAEGICWRHDALVQRLEEAGGRLSTGEAMDLLRDVSQANTQWSILYDISHGELTVSMGRNYEERHRFELEQYGRE